VTIAARAEARPAFWSVPPYDFTAGPEVADLCERAGFVPDQQQRAILDVIFAERAGRRAFFEIAVIAPRQNLKTGVFKMAALGKMFMTDRRLIVWSAHEFSTSQEAFLELCELIENRPDLRRRLRGGNPRRGFSQGNGEEAIRLASGQRLKFKARTKTGGRGLSGDDLFLDEAFALRSGHMGSLLGTLLARPEAQVLYGSSAGQDDSDILRRVRERGRAGGDPGLAYIEYCDPDQNGCQDPACDHRLGTPGCALDDEDRWYQANPSLGDRITIELLRQFRRALPPDEFAREHMGWWDEPGGSPVIPTSVWEKGDKPKAKFTGRPSLAVDVDPMRTHTSVALAGAARGGRKKLVQVVASGEGTIWGPARVIRTARKRGIEVVHLVAGTAGGASAFRPALEEAGLEVHELSSSELGRGCAQWYDLAIGGNLLHHNQDTLNDALGAARLKDNGEGAWVWSRRRSTDDITPLMAATAALQGHLAGDEHGEVSVFFFDDLDDDDKEQ
jgi:hypothetical protein